MHLQQIAQRFAEGRSYWSIRLTTGKHYTELDTIDDPTRGKRSLDWHLDVAASGDAARIAELWLHTPGGDVALKITEPYSAYIFNSSLFATGRSQIAQIVGRVDDKAQGTGVAFIWDVAQKQIYRDDNASVLNFKAWRPGIVDVGALAIHNMGVRL